MSLYSMLAGAGSLYERDLPLAKQLGLDVLKPLQRDWTDLGTVKIPNTQPFPGMECSTVKVECSAMPAQFWRFTVVRYQDVSDPKSVPYETRVISTGSGTLTEYWPVAKMVANHMLDVETP